MDDVLVLKHHHEERSDLTRGLCQIGTTPSAKLAGGVTKKGQNFLPSEKIAIIKEIKKSRISHRPSKHEEKVSKFDTFPKGSQFDYLIHLKLVVSNLL